MIRTALIQLVSYTAHPSEQKLTQRAGVLVIQSQMNTDNELCQSIVFSQNEQINDRLAKQLPGRKVVGYGSGAAELHTVRLEPQPE